MTLPYDPDIRWHAQFKYLKPWTDIATRGLSDDARTRVLEEITAHFEDAVDHGTARGLSEEQAARAAVESLGSARSARRAFRRTYLTRWQAKTLYHLRDTPLRVAVLFVFGMLTIPTMAVWLPHSDPVNQQLRLTLAGILVLAAITRAAIVPLLFRRQRNDLAVVVAGCAEFFFWSSFSLSGALRIERTLWILPLYFLILAIPYIPLARKMGRGDAEPSPPGPA